MHAYSEALRAQLDGTDVSELVPPAVATRPEAKQRNPRALDLADFATEVMELLQTNPTPHEILVKGVLMHRWAERDGTYDELVAQRSHALAMLPAADRAVGPLRPAPDDAPFLDRVVALAGRDRAWSPKARQRSLYELVLGGLG